MNDDQWERIEAKRAQAAYFRGLELAAHKAARRRPTVIRTKVSKPKPEPRKWGLVWPQPIGPRLRPPSRAYKRIPPEQWKQRTGRPVKRPDNCRGCGRTFRPRQTKVADYPGTVYHAGHGLCRTCEQHPALSTTNEGSTP